MNNLQKYRTAQQLTQAELAAMLNVTPDYISMIEVGKRNPGFKLAKQIADILGTSVDAIFFS